MDRYGARTLCTVAFSQEVYARLWYFEQSALDWFVVATTGAGCAYACTRVAAGATFPMSPGWYFTQGVHWVLCGGQWVGFYSWSSTYHRP